MTKLDTLIEAQTISQEQLDFYQNEGYVLLPGAITPEVAQALRAEVMDIMDKIGLEMSKLRQTDQYLEGSLLDSFINSPQLLAIAEQLMGGPSSLYLPFTAVKSGGGGGRFHFHQDNQFTTFDAPGVNLWFALNPMTKENGCLQLVPRSHLQGTLGWVLSGDGDNYRKIDWEPSEFLAVEMSPGDCVAFSRTTIHGSGINETQEPRVGYAVQFHRNDVRYKAADGEIKLLKDFPRFNVKPVKEITVPLEKKDGH